MRVLAAGERTGGAWRPGLLATLAELGHGGARDRRARSRLRGGSVLAAAAACGWPRSPTSPTPPARSRTARSAALLYPLLAPLAGTNVMIGHGVACYGSADRYLGMLAATLGDVDAAGRHFEAALERNRRMGARTWLAHTDYEYGRMLHREGERERAQRLLAEAVRSPRTSAWRRSRHARGRSSSTPGRPCPTGSRSGSWTCCCASREGSPTARSARSCSSASTRPPTTCAASCARPARPTAPRRPPTRTGAAWPRGPPGA